MHIPFLRRVAGIGSLIAATLLSGGAHAAIIGSTTPFDFTGASRTFGYLGATFTLSDNGSNSFSPVSASTSGTGRYATDFAGISVFFDPPRNDELFDAGLTYVGYPSATVLSFSAFPTFIALALTGADGIHYGYAEFDGTLLESYAFQTVAGVGIAPGAALVPEPETIALLGLGLAGMALSRRRRA